MTTRRKKKKPASRVRRANHVLYPKPRKPPSYAAAHWGLPATDVHRAKVHEPSDNHKLIALGPVHSIVYVTRKGGDQDPVEYIHKFKASDPPLLAYGDKDGKLYFVGGAYYMTEHGIVD